MGKLKLAVVLLTYNRYDYAETTLRSLLDGIVWDGDLRVHIADDGSPADYADSLRAIAGGYAKVNSTGISNSERRGYGANYNLATQHTHGWADYVLPIEDDWKLVRVLDCRELVRVLGGDIGCLRLGYLGFTQALHGEIRRTEGGVVLLLDPLSPEPHVFAGHPRLETVGWQKQVGPWPEGLDPNKTEFFVATDMARRGIAWPMWTHPDGGHYFTHIGSERAR